MSRFAARLASAVVLVSTASAGQSGSIRSSMESRLVYPVNIQLINREWKTQERIRLRVTVRLKKELFDGLKIRVFRGTIKYLTAYQLLDESTQCNRYESIYFMPVVENIHPLDTGKKNASFWAMLDLGGAATEGWLDLPGVRTDYVVVFERSVDELPSHGPGRWIHESLLLKQEDTSKYFRDYGVAITIIENDISRPGLQAIAKAASSGILIRHSEGGQTCRSLKEVEGGMLMISQGSICKPPPQSVSIAVPQFANNLTDDSNATPDQLRSATWSTGSIK